MRKTRTMALAGVAAMVLGGAAAQAEDSGPVTAGKGVAQLWCVNCHVVSTAQTSGSDQAPTWQGIADRPGMTAERLHNFLEKPHGKMPDFKLGDTDIDNVASYILSLKH